MSLIASRAKKCVALFTRCATLVREPESAGDEHDVSESQVTDAFGRFRIWAGNIGATQSIETKSSLEFRLREAPKIATQINEILDDLVESLEDAASILSNARQNRIGVVSAISADGGEQEISELHEIFESINDGINTLFRFSILLRNNTNRDRYPKATAAGAGSPFNEQFDIHHVAHKFPALRLAGKEWLIERLGKAISQRRQYLKYCREHRDKTSNDRDSEPSQQVSHQTLSPVPHMNVERHLPPQSEYSKPASTLAPTQASTLVLNSNQIVEEGLSDDAQSQTSYATSVDEGNSSSNLHVVPIEDVSKGLSHFECIYCWQIQTAKSQKAWKKHVLADLKAYVCTFEDCELKLFSDRHAWFSHELQEHRCEWQCHFCTHKPFEKSGNYATHLVAEHNLPFTTDQLPAILEMSQRAVTKVSPTDCPFCEDWEARLRAVNPHISPSEDLIVTPIQFQRHVGGHMDQLALFAIPRGYTEKGDADSGSAAAAHDDSDGISLSETGGSNSELVEDLNRCQEVLEELLSEGYISDHFKLVPLIPTFSMWISTGDFVQVSPLDLRTISQKLASGKYPTARDFQIDIILMFAMHRITRTNERDVYFDSKVVDLFTTGWRVSFSVIPFTQIVSATEQKMRWLFHSARKMSPFKSGSDVLRITFTMANGNQLATQLGFDFFLRELYAYIECYELFEDLESVPIVGDPGEYSNRYFFVLKSSKQLRPRETLDIESDETIGSYFGANGSVKIFVEHLPRGEWKQMTWEKDYFSDTVGQGDPPKSVGLPMIDPGKTGASVSLEGITRNDRTDDENRSPVRDSIENNSQAGFINSSMVQPLGSMGKTSTSAGMIRVIVSHNNHEILLEMPLHETVDNWVSKDIVARLHAEPTNRPMELQTIFNQTERQLLTATSEVELSYGKIDGPRHNGIFFVSEDNVSFGILLGQKDLFRVMPAPSDPPPSSSLKREQDEHVLTQEEESEWTRIFEAVEAEDVLLVRELLETFPKNSRLPESGQVLRIAAASGNIAMLETLLDSGMFDINEPDTKGKTALYVAQSRGHYGPYSASDLLVRRGAELLDPEDLILAQKESQSWLETFGFLNQNMASQTLKGSHETLISFLNTLISTLESLGSRSSITKALEPCLPAWHGFQCVAKMVQDAFGRGDMDHTSHDVMLEENITSWFAMSSSLLARPKLEHEAAIGQIRTGAAMCISFANIKLEEILKSLDLEAVKSSDRLASNPREDRLANFPSSLPSDNASLIWTIDRVVQWLFQNKFSKEWEYTFKALDIYGSQFLELPNEDNRSQKEFITSQVLSRLEANPSPSGSYSNPVFNAAEEMERLCDLVSRISKGKGKLVDSQLPVDSIVPNDGSSAITPEVEESANLGFSLLNLGQELNGMKQILEGVARLEPPNLRVMAPLENRIMVVSDQLETFYARHHIIPFSTDEAGTVVGILQKSRLFVYTYLELLEKTKRLREKDRIQQATRFERLHKEDIAFLCETLSKIIESVDSKRISAADDQARIASQNPGTMPAAATATTADESKYFYETKWNCCQCPDTSGGMDREASPFCPDCSHHICGSCPVYSVRRRITERARIASRSRRQNFLSS